MIHVMRFLFTLIDKGLSKEKGNVKRIKRTGSISGL